MTFRFFGFFLAALLSLSLCFTGFSHADIYMLKDSRGTIHFTDTPPAKKSRVTIIKRYKTRGKPVTRTNRSWPRYRAGRSFSSRRYDHLIRAASSRYNLDPLLVKSIIKVESGFNRFSVSSKGARGLMQLMPGTARDMRVFNVFDPAQNINGGVKYLKLMINKFGGDLRLALAAYNAGPTTVIRYRGVPPFPETIRYIRKVQAAYRSLSGYSRSLGRYARGWRKSTKTVVYTYRNREGSTVYTDRPVGLRRVIKR